MKTYRDFIEELDSLTEGVHDKNIFHSIHIGGAPGAGKSYVTNEVTSGFNLKYINSDDQFERALKKLNMSMDMSSMSDEDYEKALEIRSRTKKLTSMKMDLALQGRLGLVIDGTSREYDRIKNQVGMLRNLGYETSMILVNVPLEVSLKRNKQRERSLPDRLVRQIYDQVQANIGKYQNLFGPKNFIIVDNVDVDDNILLKVRKRISKIVNKPVTNRIAQKWIEKEMELKRQA